MSLLLDTHVYLWWTAGDPIEPEAAARITDPATLVFVSAASVWEIAIKRGLGKVRFEGPVAEAVSRGGFDPLRITAEHAERAGDLPSHHRDPFDRMLIAQAQIEGLTLVARDPAFGSYDVTVLGA